MIHIVMLCISFLLFMILIIAAFIAFGRVVKIEHEEYRDAWIADGRPSGMFIGQTERLSWRSGCQAQNMMIYWMLRTPAWAREHRRARELLWRMRLCIVLWLLSFVSVIYHQQMLLHGATPWL